MLEINPNSRVTYTHKGKKFKSMSVIALKQRDNLINKNKFIEIKINIIIIYNVLRCW